MRAKQLRIGSVGLSWSHEDGFAVFRPVEFAYERIRVPLASFAAKVY